MVYDNIRIHVFNANVLLLMMWTLHTSRAELRDVMEVFLSHLLLA